MADASKPRSIADIIASAKPRESTVTLCLAGDLAGRIGELEQQLGSLADWQPNSMADSDPRIAIAEQIAEAQELMRGSEQPFTFRALPAKVWSDLLAEHPGRNAGEAFNPETLLPALVPVCCVEPTMTPEEYASLSDVLNAGQRDALEAAAWKVNNEATSVPFSLAGSVILASRSGER